MRAQTRSRLLSKAVPALIVIGCVGNQAEPARSLVITHSASSINNGSQVFWNSFIKYIRTRGASAKAPKSNPFVGTGYFDFIDSTSYNIPQRTELGVVATYDKAAYIKISKMPAVTIIKRPGDVIKGDKFVIIIDTQYVWLPEFSHYCTRANQLSDQLEKIGWRREPLEVLYPTPVRTAIPPSGQFQEGLIAPPDRILLKSDPLQATALIIAKGHDLNNCLVEADLFFNVTPPIQFMRER